MNERNFKSVALKWLRLGAIFLAVYLANIQVQTWLGKRAIEETALTFLPIEQGLAQARASGRPVLVDFSAIWCGACRAMHQNLFTDPGVKDALARDYVLVRVDYDSPEAEGFMQRYGVRGFPTLLVVDAAGTLLRRLPVPASAPEFVALLEQAG